MIREYIENFLEGHRIPDREVLKEMGDRFLTTTFRQFMTERETVPGKYYPSAATKCPRQNGLRYAGFESEPLDAQTLFKFWYGDLTEAGFIGLAQLALKETPHSIGQNNAYLPVKLGKAHQTERNGYIDGLLDFDHEYHWEKYKKGLRPRWLPKGEKETILIETKSMGSYAFKKFREEGPRDTWGYLGQINSYLRELNIKRYLYVAIDKEKGNIAEYIGEYDHRVTQRADRNYDLVMDYAQKGDIPPMPTDQELVGEKPNGELNVVCNYCSYKHPCAILQGKRIEVRYVRARTGQKPIYYMVPDEPGTKTTRDEMYDKISELIPEEESSYSRD